MTEKATNHVELKCFFEPESVAVVGASRDPEKYGHSLLKNLLDLGYKGKIYPVNPKADEILGLKAYPRVDLVDHDVDLAIIIVPAPTVPQVVKDCSRKHVKGAVVCSSGFREAGKAGQRLEEEMVKIAKEAGLRIIGPNTTGILNTSNNFTTSFVALPKLKKGNVAFIAQTGLLAAATFWWIISTQPFHVSKVVGLGNKCDVDDAEVLQYLAEDEDTKVIAIYMEGVKEGQKLFTALKRVTRHKPVIILKSGKSQSGIKASFSHTGSIEVRDEIFSAVCKQTGAIRVNGGIEELMDMTKAFASQPLPKGNRIAVITVTGAGGVMAADECEDQGLELATLSEKTLSEIRCYMPPWAKTDNPLDIEPLFETVGPADSVRIPLELALDDPNVDSIAVFFAAVPRLIPFFDVKSVITEVKDRHRHHQQKPILTHLIGFKETVDSWTAALEAGGILAFSSIERCIRAHGAMWKYQQFKNRELHTSSLSNQHDRLS
jgi:acyl-CoA synthetase (NDP forming)